MNLLSRFSTRSWLVVGSAVLVACGALGVACSNNPGFQDGGGPDSGNDVGKSDGPIKTDGGPGPDGGDGSLPPCTTTKLTGQCDIVQQNCPNNQQCVAAQAADGGFVAQCVANGSGTFPEGYACTDTTQCVSGLECFFGRCAKHCCLNQDSECGKAQPEGFSGKCDLNITDNSNTPMYSVCTYTQPCQPFHVQTCGSGLTCIVQDSSGTSSCYGFSSVDGGKPEKAVCTANNDCADGLLCLPAQDGGAASCVWECYSSATGPYDAGIMEAGAGYGGCPNPEKCQLVTWQNNALPAWLGY